MTIEKITVGGEAWYYVADSQGLPISGGYCSQGQAEDVKETIERGYVGELVPKGINIARIIAERG
jgi:hypothetical protein